MKADLRTYRFTFQRQILQDATLELDASSLEEAVRNSEDIPHSSLDWRNTHIEGGGGIIEVKEV